MTTDNQIVIPGEQLNNFINDDDAQQSNKRIFLGPGIRNEGNLKLATKAGILKSKKSPDAYWIDSVQKRVMY